MADAQIIYVRHGVPDVAATRGSGIRLRSPGEPRPLRLLPSPESRGFEWASAREFNLEGRISVTRTKTQRLAYRLRVPDVDSAFASLRFDGPCACR